MQGKRVPRRIPVPSNQQGYEVRSEILLSLSVLRDTSGQQPYLRESNCTEGVVSRACFRCGDYGQRLPFAPNTAVYRTERNYRLVYRTGVLSIAGGSFVSIQPSCDALVVMAVFMQRLSHDNTLGSYIICLEREAMIT